MSDTLTRIILKPELRNSKYGSGSYGYLDWGKYSFEEMLNKIKEKATMDLEIAQSILNAKKEDFICHIVKGSVMQRPVEDIKP